MARDPEINLIQKKGSSGKKRTCLPNERVSKIPPIDWSKSY